MDTLFLHAVVLCALAAAAALAGTSAALHAAATWRRAPRRAPVEAGLKAELAAIRAADRLRRGVAVLAAALWLPASTVCLLWRASLTGDRAIARAFRGVPDGADLAFALAHGSAVALAVAAGLGALLALRRAHRPAPLDPVDLGLPPLLPDAGIAAWWAEEPVGAPVERATPA